MNEYLNYNNQKLFKNKYKIIELLGSGSYGDVYLAEQMTPINQKVAIKVVKATKDSNDEVKICKLLSDHKMKHENILNVFDVFIEYESIYYVTEYLAGGELYHRLRFDKIKESQVKIWFKQIIKAVAYLHEHGIIHRDLKPENDNMDHIRLCDFGFGKILDANKLVDTYCGSPLYAAPEMLALTPYHGPPVDMWSCGVILYTMLTGENPYEDPREPIFKEASHISNEANDLIKSLLCINPKKRMTAKTALKHPWFMDKKKKIDPPYYQSLYSTDFHYYTYSTPSVDNFSSIHPFKSKTTKLMNTLYKPKNNNTAERIKKIIINALSPRRSTAY